MKTVVFVCEHGAFRSRIAAAYFNACAPPGWRAMSAGKEPQPEVSTRVGALLAGEHVQLETGAPRPFSAVSGDHIIALDCDAPADERWSLAGGNDKALRDEIRRRVVAFAKELSRRA